MSNALLQVQKARQKRDLFSRGMRRTGLSASALARSRAQSDGADASAKRARVVDKAFTAAAAEERPESSTQWRTPTKVAAAAPRVPKTAAAPPVAKAAPKAVAAPAKKPQNTAVRTPGKGDAPEVVSARTPVAAAVTSAAPLTPTSAAAPATARPSPRIALAVPSVTISAHATLQPQQQPQQLPPQQPKQSPPPQSAAARDALLESAAALFCSEALEQHGFEYPSCPLEWVAAVRAAAVEH